MHKKQGWGTMAKMAYITAISNPRWTAPSKGQDVDAVYLLLRQSQKAGVRTTANMAYIMALTAVQTDQRERGRELAKEMELNGVR